MTVPAGVPATSAGDMGGATCWAPIDATMADINASANDTNLVCRMGTSLRLMRLRSALVGLRNTVARDGMPWPDEDTYLVFL